MTNYPKIKCLKCGDILESRHKDYEWLNKSESEIY